MAERVFSYGGRSSAGASGKNPYIGTFHWLGARILRKECRLLRHEPNFAIFDDHDSFDLVQKALRVFLSEENVTMTNPRNRSRKTKLRRFCQTMAKIKNDVFMKGKRANHISPEKESQIGTVFGAYEAALQRNNAFGFDNQIQKPVICFRENPGVCRKYQIMFDAVLVDEWQDINPMQYEFVRLLAGGHRNLSVVGDNEQTIYTSGVMPKLKLS